MTIENQLRAIIGELAAGLPAAVIEHLRDFVDAGELQLAVEEACAYIDEIRYKVSAAQLETIKRLGKEVGVDAKWWRTIGQQ